jgi:hypothetical protein
MSRFAYEQHLVTDQPVAACLEAASQALAALGAEIIDTGADEIRARIGSPLVTRLMAGSLNASLVLPLTVRVRITDRAPRRELTVIAAENFGGGWLWGMAGGYRAHCQRVARLVAEGCAAHLR